MILENNINALLYPFQHDSNTVEPKIYGISQSMPQPQFPIA